MVSSLVLESPAFTMDLSRIAHRLCRKLQWSEERCSIAVEEYRRFFYLIGNFKTKGQVLVPAPDVDEVWHAHILHTPLYKEHCDVMCGKFIHHDPAPMEYTDEVHSVMEKGFLNTLSLYADHFGEQPNPAVWTKGEICSGTSNCTRWDCR